ncbi:formyltransferase family protein [Pseudomonas sp. dw_612]|uniref:formyltransferase family protein n=1 Tax=Pseudomonas sp. dw_612 TaxID=2720080 RepID=UPI001BD31B11|nr:formyltransferase family protein [Pseudomonas sp. dw_612]
MLIGAISDYLKSWRSGIDFAYLNFKDHPRGCEMLEHLIENGHKPSLVIEELCEAGIAGTLEQNEVLQQLPGYIPGETAENLCRRHDIPYRIVSNLNDEQCLHLIQASGVELIILGDTRIIKSHLIDASGMGIINVHPGILPEVRGNNPYAWAVLEGAQQGVTVHFIDKGVDTGPILKKVLLDTAPKNYAALVKSLNTLCAQALVSVLDNLANGLVSVSVQPDNAPPTRKEASKDIKKQANHILESGRMSAPVREQEC